MRQTAISKLSKLKTTQRAELLELWTATLGSPPQFRASRELLASALAGICRSASSAVSTQPQRTNCA
jgi:hypothetical protein